MSEHKPILCLDFDGVIHGYQSGWQGADCCPDPMVPGTVEFLIDAVKEFRVAIFSSRSNQPGGIQAMQHYMRTKLEQVLEKTPARQLFAKLEWPHTKPPALVTIDDRALTFTGRWDDFRMELLRAFKPWNKI